MAPQIIEPINQVYPEVIRDNFGNTRKIARRSLPDTNLAIVLEACRWLDGSRPKYPQPFKPKDTDPVAMFLDPTPKQRKYTQPTESTHYMSKSSELINTSPFATANFIYGAVALDMTEPELLSALARVKADEAELAEIDPDTLSPYTKQRKETLTKARTAIGVLLDKLPAKPDTFTVSV